MKPSKCQRKIAREFMRAVDNHSSEAIREQNRQPAEKEKNACRKEVQ